MYGIAGLAAVLLAATAAAQTAPAGVPEIAKHSALSELLQRLDRSTIALVLAALIIIALLVWRILHMVRRERIAKERARRQSRRGKRSGDTLSGSTDWGFDQNKRSGLVRAAPVPANARSELPSLESATTQWTMSDIHNAGNSLAPDDAMGKSPLASTSLYKTSFNPYFRRETPVMEVVEVADTLMQAELLVQLGDPKQAMTLLSQHIRETEKPGPAVWLMLLSLYQSTGREAQYNALSAGFRVLFNAQLPSWATSDDAMLRDVESYQPVLEKLQAAWGGAEARPLLERLLNDDRGGSRQGFTLTAYRELLFLLEIVDQLDAMAAEQDERQDIERKLVMPN